MADKLFIGGFSCCAAALFFYKTATVDESNAEILRSITRVKHLKDLAQLLDAEKSPLLVTISGRVDSETPIIVEDRAGQLIILKKVATKQKTKFDDDDDDDSWTHKCDNHNDGSWKHKCDNHDDCWEVFYGTETSTPKEVPWYLDDGTDRVRVVGALGSIDFKLLVENSTFKESDWKLACETLSNHKVDNKTIVYKKIERVLPDGTSLNVVGEASRDDDGTIQIQPSLKMKMVPFYVSSKTIDEHTTKFVDSSRWNKNTFKFLTWFGACIIATSALCYFFADDTALNYEPDSQIA